MSGAAGNRTARNQALVGAWVMLIIAACGQAASAQIWRPSYGRPYGYRPPAYGAPSQRYHGHYASPSSRPSYSSGPPNYHHGGFHGYPASPSVGGISPGAPADPGARAAPQEKGEPRPDFQGEPQPVTIVCPKAYESPVQYTLNSSQFTIRPGQTQRFSEDRLWIIRFDRGGGFGAARYRLPAGLYEFRHTKQGWELYTIR